MKNVLLLAVLVVAVLTLTSEARPERKTGRTGKNRLSRKQTLNFQYVPNAEAPTCGYDSCPKYDPNMLNVHLVAHTHDDVGWLKTVDQYYYGSKSLIQKAGVQYIIDSVVQSLLQDPKKKFIYVESAFFYKWWREQTPEMQDKVRQLVNEGRLEFIGGGWSMNDEATTHYQSIIDQMSLGLRFLNDTFGDCGRPRVGWQIDPFGHSREMGSIFAQMGFDGMFIGRLDYEDKNNRLSTQTPEMIWRTSQNLPNSELFMGALYNNYSPPPGFCFDILCSDEPIIDGKHSRDNNVQDRVDKFFDYVLKMSSSYRSNNVLITMGEDFNFQDANMWYKNLDKLIKYSNARQVNGSNINVFYSTPSCYLKSLHDSGRTWPVKTDDFFPYASDPHAFWTGYFTSRPTLKRFERVGNHFLQVCKKITSMAKVQVDYFEPHLRGFSKVMGIMQHHDAVAGTEKQQVADDYARMLHVGMQGCSTNTKMVLNSLTAPNASKGKYAELPFDFGTCYGLNISKCEVSEEAEKFVVTLFNPLAHSNFQYVRVPVNGPKYEVMDYKGVEVVSEMIPVPDSIARLSFRHSNAQYELVFMATELPPLGYKSYFISRVNNDIHDELAKALENPEPEVIHVQKDAPTGDPSDPIVIGNKYFNLTFDATGFISTITIDGVSNKLTQAFVYYEGAVGDNREFANRSSGAYIFRPNGTEKLIAKEVTNVVYRGALVDEVHQTFNSWISQVVRVYKQERHVEFEWLVGPIPLDDNIGKEIVSRFYTTIDSKGVFYTDSNGREMIRRERNHRDTWHLHLHESIAGNYYPVTAKIAIEDSNYRMAVLNDRAQGGSSMLDGSVELMVHRRLMHDDAFGVGEALNETAYGKGLVARGSHYLVFGKKNSASPTLEAQERFLQTQKLLPNWVFFSNASDMSYENWQSKYSHIYSALSLALPQNVHLLTMEPLREYSLLVRFEHILELNEDPEYSKPVAFNLEDIFRSFDIIDVRETTLAGSQWLENASRFKFQPDPTEQNSSKAESPANVLKQINMGKYSSAPNYKADFQITLSPMQIRTFIIELNDQPRR